MTMNNLKISSDTGTLLFTLNKEHHLEYEVFEIVSQTAITMANRLILEWELPSANIMSQWHPTVGMDRSLKADWELPVRIANSRSAPVLCLIDGEDRNIQAFALSEFTNEMTIQGGVHEENGQYKIRIVIELSPTDLPYSVKLYVSEVGKRYERVLSSISSWWQQECGVRPLAVPEVATKAMYSTWYAYHQGVSEESLIQEAKLAKALGLQTMIIDDGWQTVNQDRGYGYTGDWQVSHDKFGNFQKFVSANHDLGMKVMIWYSVPFIGKFSQNWDQFSTKLLTYDEARQAGILDLRYQSNCDYLVSTYVDAVTDWSLDGLKLDFIDEFYLRSESQPYDAAMDFTTIERGLEYMLKALTRKVLALNPNCLIEFRQRYIGPSMRQYGNMFRVDDCPKSALTNRVGLVDLRLISGATSCHSDMLMWHPDESAENVAIQLLACLYGVVQLSMKIGELSDNHLNVLRNYLRFSAQYSQVLAGDIQAHEPENLYPFVKVENDATCIMTLYSRHRVVVIDNLKPLTIIINGTQSRELVLMIKKMANVEVCIYDCYGTLREKRIMEPSGSVCLPQFPGGRIEMKPVKK